ncbi:MAG: hypothetical protein JOY98_07345, partial [Candidatus Eremiobacteraeota bacterium]|nr:hypothetical protein [Candidatus Eremiobacteraeota bacterium]
MVNFWIKGMMKIWEYDLRLYRLLKRCLTGDYVSPLRDQLTPAMRAGMLASLRTPELGDRCGCGDSFCRTFTTRATRSEKRAFISHGFTLSLHRTAAHENRLSRSDKELGRDRDRRGLS